MAGFWSNIWSRFTGRGHGTGRGGVRSMPLASVISWGESGRRVRSSWSEETAIDEGLRKSGWVLTCAMTRAESIASLPTKIQFQRDDTWVDADEGPRHPLQKLLEEPNEDHDRFELLQRGVLGLDFGGNLLFTKGRGLDSQWRMDGVTHLWPIPSDELRPVLERGRGITHYEKNRSPDLGAEYPKRDVIHIQGIPDPRRPYWGISRLEALGFAVDGDVAAAQYNARIFSQGHRPSGLLSLDGHPTQEQLDSVRNAFERRHGGAENSGRIAIFGHSAKFTPFALNAEKLQVTDGRKLNREEIFAGFGVPPVLGGDYSKANYNNTREAMRIYWLLTGIPLAKKVYGGLARGLREDFGDGVRVWFDTSEIDVLSDLTQDQVDKAETLHKMGIPIDEINRRLRLGLQLTEESNVVPLRPEARDAHEEAA